MIVAFAFNLLIGRQRMSVDKKETRKRKEK